MTIDKFSVEARSGSDPIIYANYLTEGSYNFGSAKAELLYIGYGVFFCCLGLTIQPIFYIGRKLWPSKLSREEKYAEQRDEDDMVDLDVEMSNTRNKVKNQKTSIQTGGYLI